MNTAYIKGISLISSVLFAMAAISGCSKWTEPENIDFDRGIDNPSKEYLESLRAYKSSEHKVAIAMMKAASSQPVSRKQHIMAMPDSLDYICVTNATEGLFPSVAGEISEVLRQKGTEVLCGISYTDIYDEWTAMEEAKEDEPEGTEEEYRQFVGDRVKSQLECCDRYGFAGILVTFEATRLGFHKAGQEVFFSAVDNWRTSHSNHTLILRGSFFNLIDMSIMDYCKYIVVQVGKAYSDGMFSSEVSSAFIGIDTGKDKVVVEVSVPNDENPQNEEYITEYQPIAAARWINSPADEGYVRQGILVSNIQEDYFVGNSYTTVKKAISIMNDNAE